MTGFTNIYVGFNTIDRLSPSYSLTDVELVKRDILNEFNTHRGERLMLPTYGTRIFEYVFNPLDELTRTDIRDDVELVLSHEPRVTVSDVEILETINTIEIRIELIFLPSMTTDQLLIEFSKEDIGEET